MLAFIIRRLLQAELVMLAVAVAAFVLFRYVSDPVSQMLGQGATPEDCVCPRAGPGLEQPRYLQFATCVDNAAQGDCGISLRRGRAVSMLIQERSLATFKLAFAAACIAIVGGIAASVYTALRRNSWISHILLAASLVGISLLTFLIGILLIGLPVARHGPNLHPVRAVRGPSGDGGLPCLIGLVFVLINPVVDLLYFAVEPRLCIDRAAAAH